MAGSTVGGAAAVAANTSAKAWLAAKPIIVGSPAVVFGGVTVGAVITALSIERRHARKAAKEAERGGLRYGAATDCRRRTPRRRYRPFPADLRPVAGAVWRPRSSATWRRRVKSL